MTTPTNQEVHCYLCDTLGSAERFVQMDFGGYIACVCPECMKANGTMSCDACGKSVPEKEACFGMATPYCAECWTTQQEMLDGWGDYHAKFGLTAEQADAEYDGRDA